jgi:signal peptidase I
MITNETVKPHHSIGLVAIAFTLGAPALMLWMGRFKLSLIYAISSVLLIIAWLFGAANGYVSTLVTSSLSLDMLFSVSSWTVAAIGLFHSFQLNKAPPLRPWYSKWFVALPAYTVLFVAIALTVRTFLYQPFNNPSTSNEPSIMRGDYVLVSKLAYRNDDPQRGDIAVFKLTSDTSISYMKRIIGIPGDRIQMKGGVVYLNDQALKQEPVTLDPIFAYEPGVSFYRETLPNGRSYVISNTVDDGPVDNTDVYVVPEGHYFAMGDNRDKSQDSRYLEPLGYIPQANFVGRYAFRFWNSSGVSLVGRPEEIYPKP